MRSSLLFAISPIIAPGSCHAVILEAQGDAGSPASVGFQVDLAISRNCTGISPCQQDTTIIRDSEIKDNVVNSCGRTQLKGNIDVGENTENALAAGQVTQVKAGSKLTVTLHQVNADGAGPFACDLDETSNAGVKFTNLTVTNNVPGANGLSQGKTQDFDINVQLPDNLKCTGGSTGNICTVRCRNNSVAGPFGGCFAIQQTDTEKTVNSASSIETKQSLSDVLAQVKQNQADFPTAVKANDDAGSDESANNLRVVQALLNESVVSKPASRQTAAPVNDEVGKKPGTQPNREGDGDVVKGGQNKGGKDKGSKDGTINRGSNQTDKKKKQTQKPKQRNRINNVQDEPNSQGGLNGLGNSP